MKNPPFLASTVCVLALAVLPASLHAASATWINTASTGSWGLVDNWDAGIPNGADEVATFAPTVNNLTVTNNVTGLTLGGIAIGATANRTTTINGGTITFATTTGTPTLQLNANQGLTFGSTIAGTQGLTISSSNNGTRIQFNASNTISGQIVVNGGSLIVNSNAALGAVGAGNELVLNAGNINFGSATSRTVGKSFILNSTSTGGFTWDTSVSNGNVTLTGDIVNNLSTSTNLFNVTAGGNATLSPVARYNVDGVISGNGFNIYNAGGGNGTLAVTLRNANTFTGNVTLSTGGAQPIRTGYQALVLGNDSALSTARVNANAVNNLIAAEGTTARNLSNTVAWTSNTPTTGSTNFTFTVGQADIAISASTNTTIGGSGNLTVGDFITSANSGAGNATRTLLVTGDTVFSVNGVFSRSGSLPASSLVINKAGTGTLSLDNAANTFDGTLAVAAGTLRGSGKSGAAVIQSGAVLSGGKAGVLGSTLTFDGSLSAGPLLTFNPGATLRMDLGGTSVSGISLLNGTTGDIIFDNTVINFNVLSELTTADFTLFTATAADQYSGLTVDGSGFITGGLSIGTGLEAYGPTTLRLDGSNIVLAVTPVPEPRTWAMIALGLGGLLVLARRRSVAGR